MTFPNFFSSKCSILGRQCSVKRTLSRVALIALLSTTPLTLAAQTSQVSSLLARARAQQQAGHQDLATQTWQQVLLVDPRDREALAGLARAAKLAGKDAEASSYLDRLRQIDPGSPEIAKIEATASSKSQTDQLQKAAKLAQDGHAAEALQIYRSVWGSRPPDGDWALAFYDTEASIESSRPDAVASLRALSAKYPADTRYSVTLGRILTYTPNTRADGLRVLEQFPQDPSAQAAVRQAHLWDAQNPGAAPQIRAYLQQHPDAQIAQSLEEAQQHAPQAPPSTPGIAQSTAERKAFAALAANQVEDAQEQFLAIQSEQPDNPRAMAGLGFLRMKQGNFPEAILLLQQAQTNGLHRRDVDDALKTARFWATVQRGTEALNANRLDEAVAAYKAALLLRPGSVDALNGLSGTYMKANDPLRAIEVYRQLVQLQAKSADAWQSLISAQVQANQPADAIETSRRPSPAVKTQLQHDPRYLRSLVAAYRASGQDHEAQAALDQALALPFPDNGHDLKIDVRLQRASLLAEAKRYAQAATLYREILYDDSDSLPAWQGLIAMQHQTGHDAEAVATVQRMAPSTYNTALEDSDFLTMLAGIYQQQNRFDLAQTLLQRAMTTYNTKAQEVPISVQMQMASIYLAKNRPDQAYAIYETILRRQPEKADAWKGLISALHQTHRDREALAELRQIPKTAQRLLDHDVTYQQAVAGIYAATGNEQAALQLIEQIQAHYRALHASAPADVDIQNAWLLYNTHDDRDLYRALMSLGGRDDLADDQRRVVQTIWATWSVRRAGEAVDAGNPKRAVEILRVAYEAFPDNTDVSKSLAGGYLKAGDPKRAMAIYVALHLSNPTAADFQSMVSAALASPDLHQAEAWLREALDKFANDPQVLALAARFEQARGDHTRAAAYWKRSLAAMPAVDPANRLAHTLDRADAGPVKRRPGATLESLLDPEGEATTQAQRPALPSYASTHAGTPSPLTAPSDSSSPLYGPDPYLLGTPPVQIQGRGDRSDTSTSDSFGTSLQTARHDSQPFTIPSDDAADAFAPPMNLDAPERRGVIATGKPASASTSPRATEHEASQDTAHQESAIEPPSPIHFLSTSPTNSSPAAAAYLAPQAAEPQRASTPRGFSMSPADPPVEPLPVQQQAAATDLQLQQLSLPPLRGQWTTQPAVHETDPRSIGEQQLASIDAGFSPWRGGTGYVNHRTGTPGFDQLTILEAPFEASTTLAGNARVTAVVVPSLLDSGVADGTSTNQLGTSVIGAKPAQQNAAGVGGEVQLSTSNIGLSLGTTPRGFLVPNITGRFNVHPASGPFSLTLARDGIKDSQLSYSGLRDPATISSTYSGNIWGGVVSNAGNLQYSRGDEMSGYYVGLGGQYISGTNVETNNRVDGVAGAYWKVLKVPDSGELTIGANFFGMHYAHNLRYFTYGQGGYFSPSIYFLANMPFTINGQYGRNLHYTVAGAIGLQAFQEDSSLYYPLHTNQSAAFTASTPVAGSDGLQNRNNLPLLPVAPVAPSFNNPSYPAQSVVGGNYDLHAEITDHVVDRWYIGTFLSLNNTRDYANQTVGFFIRFMTRQQDLTEDGPTGLFPYQGLRPLLVP